MTPVSVIIGLGCSGRMHVDCLAKLRGGGRPVIYGLDPALASSPGAAMVAELEEIPIGCRAGAVVHLCTPPHVRTGPFEAALAAGFRRFIIEKPLAIDAADLATLSALRAEYGATVLVVSNWTASALSHAIRALIDAGAAPTDMLIRQNKLRITRSRDNRSHVAALDVEVPHMLALAAMLAGPDIILRSACQWELEAGETRIADMGGARLELGFNGNGVARLETDHSSPVHERSIRIAFEDGRTLRGYYPCNGSELHSQLFLYDGDGMLVSRRFFADDTLTQFLAAAYAHFAGGPEPLSGFAFNHRICGLLIEARERCRLRYRPPATVRTVPVT